VNSRRTVIVLAAIALLLLLLAWPEDGLLPGASPPPEPEPIGVSAPPAAAPLPAESAPEVAPAPEEPPVEADPVVRLRVRVKDGNGKPVADAVVLVLKSDHYADGPELWVPNPPPPERARVASDREGVAEAVFHARRLLGVCVFAYHGDAVAITRTLYLWEPGTKEIDLVLARGEAVRVRVVDLDGRPIPEASVSLILHQVFDSMLASCGAQAGVWLAPVAFGGGVFEFPPVPESESCSGGPLRVVAPGYMSRPYFFDTEEPLPEEVEVVLERPVRIRGRILYGEREPVSGATVLAYAERSVSAGVSEVLHTVVTGVTLETVTDSEGRFVLEGFPEGGGDIQIGTPAGIPATIHVDRVRGEELDLKDEIVAGSGRISGVVVDDDGAPVPGIQVHVYHRDFEGMERVIKTDESGRFSVPDFGKGPHTITVREGARYSVDVRWGRTNGVQAGAKDVRVVLTGALLLRVDLQYAPGQELPPDPPFANLYVAWVDERGRRVERWVPVADSFRLRIKRPGLYRVIVKIQGYGTTEEQVRVMADREARVVVTMAR
jgi:Carboxypeptidase regulatory-like domain